MRLHSFDRISALALICSVVFTVSITAQVSEGGFPPSYSHSQLKALVNLPFTMLEKVDAEKLLEEDALAPAPFRYAILEKVNIDLRAKGLRSELSEQGGSVWRYRIHGEESHSLQVHLSQFLLPPEAKLYIYSDGYKEILGAFTARNNNARNSLVIADLPGNTAIIEYFEPSDPLFEGEVVIGHVGKAYKDIFKTESSEDEEGYVNVNCPEGEDWQLQKHSVCRIAFSIGGSTFLCSGALINNVNSDGTPFFLTANHCIDTESAANSTIAYFNYEVTGCSGLLKPQQTLSGATLLTTGENSDFTLLQFNNTPPATYQPYYAGWDVSGDSGTNSTGIHHPGGDPKKISLDYSPPVTYPFQINWSDDEITPPNTHWEVSFDLGITNTGSSGSPLFNDQKRIIGQLHGGNEIFKYYGKMDYSWVNANPGQPLDLYSFLDPDSTGVQVLDGFFPPGIEPDPQFYPEFERVCIDAPVKLIGFSAFDVDTWEWSFTPSDVTFEEGTDENSSEPVVRFPSSGLYDVRINATNISGSKQWSFPDVIRSGNEISLEAVPLIASDSCLAGFDSLQIDARGATSFLWTLDESSLPVFQVDNDTAKMITVTAPGKTNISTELVISLEGSHGTCSDSISYILPLISQSNDSVSKAIRLNVGRTGFYANKCAGIEPGEPSPPAGNCTGQLEWCDEFSTGEDIVGNSVWFYFVPDSTSDYAISSEGMDNQLAIYEASDSDALLAGDFTLLGANDDVTALDFNPKIKRVRLLRDSTYFIQVDGSFGNIEGRFRLMIEMLPGVSTGPDQSRSSFRIYPQPAGGELFIEDDAFPGSASVEVRIFSITGIQLYSEKVNAPSDRRIRLSLPDLESGLYIIRVKKDGVPEQSMFVVE